MSELTLIAHSENNTGIPHSLQEHLLNVASGAAQAADKLKSSQLAYYAGLWHDIGKAHPNFQQYLRTNGRTKGQDHKGAGAELAAQYFQPLTFLIAGHHGGLSDRTDIKSWVSQNCHTDITACAIANVQTIIDAVEKPPPLDFPQYLDTQDSKQVEFYLRLLFSVLVDADFLDTEAHFSQHNAAQRGIDVDFQQLWERFREDQSKLMERASESTVNKARKVVYDSCIAMAEREQGVFRLTVPTGGGKTRSGLGFALRHTRIHNLDRVIVCLPFTSIIEQNAAVYRQILGPEYVLEHHSNVKWHDSKDYPNPNKLSLRLASENWDAPIIVTTTVQFFESLFGSRTSQCRKLHNITRSCIILDEVQALPSHLLPSIIDGLTELVDRYGCTVVLSTATQPALDKSPILSGFETVTEMIPNPEKLFAGLQRVTFKNVADATWTDEQLIGKLRAERQVLCVVNTRKDAQRLWYHWDDPEVYHLSSSMCSAHRSATLQEIKKRLQHDEPCRVISTQVIEAGVDIDFPVVFRAIAPLDSIVQSAGRCNREGKLDSGKVFVFDLEAGGLPLGAYRTGTDIARQFLGNPENNLNSPATFPSYFSKLYNSVALDPDKIQEDRNGLRFKTVAEKFRMIEDNTETILVNYDSGYVEKQVQYLKSRSVPPRIVLRNVQPFTVSVSDWQHQKMIQNNLVQEIHPGIWVTQAHYHNRLGLLTEKKDPLSMIY